MQNIKNYIQYNERLFGSKYKDESILFIKKIE